MREAQLQITRIGFWRIWLERMHIEAGGVPMIQYSICLVFFSIHFSRRFNMNKPYPSLRYGMRTFIHLSVVQWLVVLLITLSQAKVGPFYWPSQLLITGSFLLVALGVGLFDRYKRRSRR
jgi:hypothetical protein